MLEANKLTTDILNYIYKQGGFSWRASTTGVFDKKLGVYRTAPKKGVSDILACYKGTLIAIEVKIGKDRLSPEQEGFIKNVQHVGGVAFVVKDFDNFLDLWKNEVENKF